MLIELVTMHKQGGVVNAALPIAQGLRNEGHEVTEHYGVMPPAFNGDITHFFSVGRAVGVTVPGIKSATIHHITNGYEHNYNMMLQASTPELIFALDDFGVRQLGRMGYTNVRRVRQAVLKDKWQPLPTPAVFTIGWLGGDTAFKRVEVVEAAAKVLGIPCISHNSSPWWPDEDIVDFYKSISCYVVASFEDGGPLPAQEALLCGRPVVTTRVGNMPDVIVHEVNGLFYDGSVDELVKALDRVRTEYDCFTDGVLGQQHRIAGPEVAKDYLRHWNAL